MLGRLKRFFAGQSILADSTLKQLNAIEDAIDRESRLSVAAPLYMRQTEAGRVIGKLRDTWAWWKFSGSASPYDCTQQVRSGGAWANGPIALTGKCYETSGKTVPANTIVRGQLMADGSVQAHYQCCVTHCTGNAVNFTVTGCNGNPLSGATCSVPGYGSCTTDCTGTCSVPNVDNGTYTVSVSKSRWNTFHQSVSITTCNTVAVTANMTGIFAGVATGYGCPGNSSGCACADPYPTTLHVTDSQLGITATLTRISSGGSAGQWQGTANAPSMTVLTDCTTRATGTAAVPITYTFSCGVDTGGNHILQLQAGYSYCCNSFSPCWNTVTSDCSKMCTGTPPCSDHPAPSAGNATRLIVCTGVVSCASGCAPPLSFSCSATDCNTAGPWGGNATTLSISE